MVLLLIAAGLLVFGAAAVGGGHGTYWLWLLGLGLAVIASVMSLWCFILRLRVVASARSPDFLSMLMGLASLGVLWFWLSGIWR